MMRFLGLSLFFFRSEPYTTVRVTPWVVKRKREVVRRGA